MVFCGYAAFLRSSWSAAADRLPSTTPHLHHFSHKHLAFEFDQRDKPSASREVLRHPARMSASPMSDVGLYGLAVSNLYRRPDMHSGVSFTNTLAVSRPVSFQ